jgi:hypothetical protein
VAQVQNASLDVFVHDGNVALDMELYEDHRCRRLTCWHKQYLWMQNQFERPELRLVLSRITLLVHASLHGEVTAVLNSKAQTPLVRFVVDLLYNFLYMHNKSITSGI